MKKTFRYILMAVALLATASCSNEWDHASQPVAGGNLQFVVSDFPAFGENPQTRASSLGTPDEGKTTWENGDVILVELWSARYGDQGVELTYKDGKWTANGTLNYLVGEDMMVNPVYAPNYEISDNFISIKDGKNPGEGEYILSNDYPTLDGSTLSISFEGVERHYSRLRIVAEANQTLTVTTTNFRPADDGTAPESYTLTADDKGNAYIYGIFKAEGTVTVYADDGETVLATHTFTARTEENKSYALDARKKEEQSE